MIAKRPIVLDASLALSLFFPDEPYGSFVEKLFMEYLVLVPDIWMSEMGNALLMSVRRKRKTEEDVRADFLTLKKLPVEIHSVVSNLEAIFNLAAMHHLSFYDASYLQLAIQQKCALATVDGALCKAAGSVAITAV